MSDTPKFDRLAGLDAAQARCMARHGYYLGAGPDGGTWVYVDAGADPNDGAPLTRVWRATPLEVMLWECGKHDDLGLLVRTAAGLPNPPARTPWWRRLARALWPAN